MRLDNYATDGFYDEMFDESGLPRSQAVALAKRLSALSDGELVRRQKAADLTLLNMGITFAVYGHEAGTEKVWPFDIVPRIVEGSEFDQIERGLKQRIRALNLFIDDVYNDQQILKERIVPPELLFSAPCYLEQCLGLKPPGGIWCHVVGTDLVRDSDGQFYVLEDNLRCPSGVSYVIENREVMKRTFPQVFVGLRIQPVEDYPERLLATLQNVAPTNGRTPNVVVLTPGIYNSAYFEHSFLAQQMGVELVEGSDLVVSDGFVCMRTTRGLQRVDVIYRRIDDTFLDPSTFRPDSCLGVPGLMDVYRRGHVALANAPGTGVADDKAVYAYVPKIIRYYLNEEPILNNVPKLRWITARRRSVSTAWRRRWPLFVMTLPHSGAIFVQAFPRECTETFLDSHRRALEFFRRDPRRTIRGTARARSFACCGRWRSSRCRSSRTRWNTLWTST